MIRPLLLVDHLRGRDQSDLVDIHSRLVLPLAELEARVDIEGKAKVYWDTTVRTDNASYVSFMKQLYSRNMICFKHNSKHNVGVFFVLKTNGKLRLIIDARAVNQILRRPHRTKLASTSAMAEVRTSPSETFFQLRT